MLSTIHVSELLRRAKALLTPDAWGQGSQGGPDLPTGKTCAMMAIDRVVKQELRVLDPWNTTMATFKAFPLLSDRRACEKEYRYLVQKCSTMIEMVVGAPSRLSAVAEWNDSHSYEEVIQGFDRAIDLAEQFDAGTLSLEQLLLIAFHDDPGLSKWLTAIPGLTDGLMDEPQAELEPEPVLV